MNVLQFLQDLSNSLIHWCVFHIDSILLIVVLLILWKVFWEMS